MIKIRLEGTPEEIEKATVHLEADGRLNILNISGFYPNRGKTKYGRVYIDAAIVEQAKDN